MSSSAFAQEWFTLRRVVSPASSGQRLAVTWNLSALSYSVVHSPCQMYAFQNTSVRNAYGWKNVTDHYGGCEIDAYLEIELWIHITNTSQRGGGPSASYSRSPGAMETSYCDQSVTNYSNPANWTQNSTKGLVCTNSTSGPAGAGTFTVPITLNFTAKTGHGFNPAFSYRIGSEFNVTLFCGIYGYPKGRAALSIAPLSGAIEDEWMSWRAF